MSNNLPSLSQANKENENVFPKSKHVCTICNKHFHWKSGLSRHVKLFHLKNKVKSYKCDICGQLFYKQIGLSIHLKQHSTLKMKYLKTPGINKPRSTLLPNKTQKISHLYANIVSETVYSSDSDCEYEILQTATKVKSLKSNHKCKFCAKTFIKPTSLQRHLKKHAHGVEIENSDKELPGGNADDPVISLNSVDCETTGNAQMYECNECNKTFKLACNLTNHLKIHLKQSVVARKELAENAVTKTRYPCALCNKIYLRKVHLDNHLSSHTNTNQTFDRLPCADCGESFTKEALEIHKQTHSLSKPFLCMVCGKGYSRSGYLSIHMRTHSDYRPHLCSVCGKSFTIKRYLIVHSRIHNQERPLKCQHCNKGFIQKGNLTEHLRIHTGIKPHNCAICGKRFTHYSGLTQHLLTHNPVKRHVCKICGKAFRLAGHYREHIRIHSGDRPYVCNICDRGFASSSSLVVHLRTHSGERPFKCTVCKKGFIKSYGLKQHKKTHSTYDTTLMLTLENLTNEYWIPSSKIMNNGSWIAQSAKDCEESCLNVTPDINDVDTCDSTEDVDPSRFLAESMEIEKTAEEQEEKEDDEEESIPIEIESEDEY